MYLNPNERAVVRSFTNYKLVGPGLVILYPWQECLDTIDISVDGQAIKVEEVRTAEYIPVTVELQILRKVDPSLLVGNLHQVPALIEGGWQSILTWRAKSVVRKLVSHYSWRTLNRQSVQERLERHLCEVLSELVAGVGLRITECCVTNIQLPDHLLETRMRMEELKDYADVLRTDFVQLMPHLTKLQLINTMDKHGGTPVILTAPDFSHNSTSPEPPTLHQRLEFAHIIPTQEEVSIA
jgi:hypothetical protein